LIDKGLGHDIYSQQDSNESNTGSYVACSSVRRGAVIPNKKNKMLPRCWKPWLRQCPSPMQ